MSERAPVATMTASAVKVSSVVVSTVKGRLETSTLVTLAVRNSAPKRCGLRLHVHHELGAHDPVGKAGKVLDLGGQHELAAGLVAVGGRFAFDDERRKVGAGCVDRRGQAGRAGPHDDDLFVLYSPCCLDCLSPKEGACERATPATAAYAHHIGPGMIASSRTSMISTSVSSVDSRPR